MKLLPLVGMAVAIALGTQAAFAAPKTVTITDSLGLNWTHELVHYPLTFADGEFKPNAGLRVRAAGKELLSQISDVLRYPDGSVKSCNGWFMADVPAHGSITYTLTPGKIRIAPADESVGVDAQPDTVSMSSGTPNPIGISLVNGTKTYDPPVAASQVPGPIRALLLASGKRAGEGRLDVPFKVKSVSTEVTARGPLFAEATVHTVFDAGYWNFTARVIKGCPTVIVHEELNTGTSNQLSSEADKYYTFNLTGQNFAPSQVFFTGRNEKPELATLVKDGMRPEWTAFNIPANWFMAAVQGADIPKGIAEDLVRITGYPTVQDRVTTVGEVQQPGGDAVGLTGLDTEYWRNPMSIRIASAANGDVQLRFPLQQYRQEWAFDGFGLSTNYTGVTLGVPENTSRRAYGIVLTPAADETKELLQPIFDQASRLDAMPLDKIKDWDLDAPDPMAKANWAAESSAKGKAALATMQQRLDVTRTMGQWARFSMAYHFGFSKREYPDISAVMDSTADLSAADRATLRHLAIWNAYDMNSTETFPYGMGFHLNNPNMSIMAAEARVKSSLLVRDIPPFKAWSAWTAQFIKAYNHRYTRPSGALYENPQYSLGVTLDWEAQVNTILMNEGAGDAFDTPEFTKSMKFIMNWLTPPDPRFLNYRMILPIGNCSYQSVPPTMATQFVNYYKDRNPTLAGQLQWYANVTLPPDKKISIVKDIVPDLKSVNYDDYGVFFRHGFGTPYETLMFLYAGNCDGHAEWETDEMGYTLFAKGQPINLSFGNGYFPIFNRPWLRNRVSIDHSFEETERNTTKVIATDFAPAVEYAHATRTIDSIRHLQTDTPVLDDKGNWAPEEQKSWPAVPDWTRIPMTLWHRQIMFVKDDDPKGPNYFVLRDGFGGTPTKPTDLSLWFLSNSMTRQGDVFHFDGQAKVDMDVFVSEPAQAEPETGKYGHRQQPYNRLVGFDPKYFPGGKLQETQQFIRFKQPTGKGYLVVLYPRLKEGDPAATFTTLGEGAVKVETPLSTDYVFMDSKPFELKTDKVQFQGTAGAVRFYKDGRITVTNTEGQATYKVAGQTVTGAGTFTANIAGGKVTMAQDTQPVTP